MSEPKEKDCAVDEAVDADVSCPAKDKMEGEKDLLLNGGDEAKREPEQQPGAGLKKELTTFNSVTFVVGSLVGSGIFITATRSLQYSGSFGLSLILWTLGGLIAACGGLSYVEMSLLIKNSGGDYAYLCEMYSFGGKIPALVVFGNTLGFLYGWAMVILVQPGVNAVLVLTFAKYLGQAIAGGNAPPEAAVILFAVAGVMFITLINIYSVKATASLVNILAICKILTLIFIGGIGLWQLIKGGHTENFTNSFEDTNTCVGELALALYSVLWAYDGWNTLNHTIEETKDADKSFPRGLVIAVLIVTGCYLLVNASYYISLSKDEIISSQATALTLGHVTLGTTGLVIISLAVSVSTLGALVISLYNGSRVLYALARDGNFMELFSGIHQYYQTPIQAILLQFLLTLTLIFTDIGKLIDGLSTAMWIFYGLSFIGLLIMRVTKRHVKRPFKVWLPVPILMALVAVFLISVPVILVADERLYSLVAIFIILTGVPVYLFFVWDRWRPNIFSRVSRKLTKISNTLFGTTSSYQSSVGGVSVSFSPSK